MNRSQLCGKCVFPQNFYIRKLDEITVFYAALVVFAITPLLRSLEIFASIISVSAVEKFKGGTNWHIGTSANSIVKPNFTIYKTNWSCVILAYSSKQFVVLPLLNFSTSALKFVLGM